MQLPLEYQKNMSELLKDEYDDYLSTFKQNHYYGLRINTHKISVDDFLKISPFELKPIDWCSSGFYFDGDKYRPAKHPYYYAGLYYLQEPSAMLPAEVLDVDDNDIILDGCAAPGGKSSQLLAKMNENAFLLSNDISPSRCKALSKNLRLTGCDNYRIISENLIDLSNKYENTFDKILLDAPCSGEGMFRKDESLIKSWQEKGNDYYQNIQKEIVLAAIKMLKQGGKIVYSTCTFSPKEDENIIEFMLDSCADLHLLPIKKSIGFTCGINERTTNCVKLFPHKILGEGHFVALLQKGEKISQLTEEKNVEADIPQQLKNFFDLIDKKWINGTFEFFKSKNEDIRVYFVKNNINSDKIRTIDSGLYLGNIKGNRFEPSNALALSLKKEQFKNVIDFDINDIRVIKYLKGDTIEIGINNYGNDYVLVCTNGYSLGFAKANGSTLKNKYEVNYRWQ